MAIVQNALGGPEALEWRDHDPGSPGRGEALLRQTVVGVNLIEIGMRQGAYPGPNPPFVPGFEGVGVVEAVGPGVDQVKVGQRVVYAYPPLGSYAEQRVFPAEFLVPLPDDIDDETAGAVFMKGLTAWMLVERVHPVQAGETILVHAAAGGTGLLMCQWAKALGATVIGTVGTDEKAAVARDHGCDYPVVYTRDNFVDTVREVVGDAGLPVVYDSVGRDTFDRSMACLAPTGTMALYGMASGEPDPYYLMRMGLDKSYFLTRPAVFVYVSRRDWLLQAADRLFGLIRSGDIRVEIQARHPLREAALAHRDVEARRTTGSTILLV
nr:quinone oxidoreductase [Methylonatrum kenyense]